MAHPHKKLHKKRRAEKERVAAALIAQTPAPEVIETIVESKTLLVRRTREEEIQANDQLTPAEKELSLAILKVERFYQDLFVTRATVTLTISPSKS